MVSIVPLQRRRRTEAAAGGAARSIFSESCQGEEEEGSMDLSGTQGELPIPMHTASPYGGVGAHGGGCGGVGGHVLELHHAHANNNGQSQALPSPPALAEESTGKKRGAGVVAGAGTVGSGGGGGGGPPVKYRECLKNHAAAIGGNATDGCGEFMPSGEEGSLEALKCSACGCHRNFHRKELDDFDGDNCAAHGMGHGHRPGRRLLGPTMPHHHKNGGGGLLVTSDPYGAYGAPRALPPPPPPPAHHQIIMPLNMIHTSESDEMDGGGGPMGISGSAARSSGGGSSSSSKKRFRTKFTAEQKARMLDFAERVGWRLQKLDDAMVQHFCQEIGVKRRVLKVWMHNNKHNLAKKPLSPQPHHPLPIPIPMPMPMAIPPSQPDPSCHRSSSSPPLPLKLE